METPNFETDAQRRYWLTCQKLHFRGVSVTLDNVISRAGGSKRDVGPIVKKFKDQLVRMAELESTELPPELEETIQRTFKTLALRIWEDARELANTDTQAVEADKGEVERQLKEERTRYQSLETDLAKLQIDFDDVKRELSIAREALKAEKEAHSNTREENSTIRGDLKAAQSTITELHNIIGEQKSNIVEVNATIRTALKESSEIEGKRLALENELRLLSNKYDELQEKYSNYRIRNHSLENDVNHLKERFETTQKQLKTTQEQLESELSTGIKNGGNPSRQGIRKFRRPVAHNRKNHNNAVEPKH